MYAMQNLMPQLNKKLFGTVNVLSQQTNFEENINQPDAKSLALFDEEMQKGQFTLSKGENDKKPERTFMISRPFWKVLFRFLTFRSLRDGEVANVSLKLKTKAEGALEGGKKVGRWCYWGTYSRRYISQNKYGYERSKTKTRDYVYLEERYLAGALRERRHYSSNHSYIIERQEKDGVFIREKWSAEDKLKAKEVFDNKENKISYICYLPNGKIKSERIVTPFGENKKTWSMRENDSGWEHYLSEQKARIPELGIFIGSRYEEIGDAVSYFFSEGTGAVASFGTKEEIIKKCFSKFCALGMRLPYVDNNRFIQKYLADAQLKEQRQEMSNKSSSSLLLTECSSDNGVGIVTFDKNKKSRKKLNGVENSSSVQTGQIGKLGKKRPVVISPRRKAAIKMVAPAKKEKATTRYENYENGRLKWLEKTAPDSKFHFGKEYDEKGRIIPDKYYYRLGDNKQKIYSSKEKIEALYSEEMGISAKKVSFLKQTYYINEEDPINTQIITRQEIMKDGEPFKIREFDKDGHLLRLEKEVCPSSCRFIGKVYKNGLIVKYTYRDENQTIKEYNSMEDALAACIGEKSLNKDVVGYVTKVAHSMLPRKTERLVFQSYQKVRVA